MDLRDNQFLKNYVGQIDLYQNATFKHLVLHHIFVRN